MAQAIRDLVWDVGLKPRALLLSDETLELNYLDGRQVKSGSATVKAAWEVSTEGYASPSDRPWHRVRGEILRVWVDESFATVVTELGLMNFDYFFNSMSAMTEVVGFQHLSGMTTAKQCFVSCTDPESVYATSFDTSALTAGCQMFYGCQKLVGGTDGTVAGNSTAYSICKLGEGGVLTDPRQRHEAVVLGDGLRGRVPGDLGELGRHVVAWGRGARAGLRPGQVSAGLRAAVVGREGPLHQGQGEGRHGDGGVHRTQHELLVLCVRGRDKLRGAGEPEVRLADAARVFVVHGCDGARPDGLRPLLAHGPLLRLRGVLGAHDDLRGCGLDPALRLHWEPVLLQLQEPRGRERHGPG